ncbi:hypothetical protein FB451DRAFT_1221453 [Mycena latifolia]|nr:hypothetical protein FB451DRAFT_1221453 [Mycena latifolia]
MHSQGANSPTFCPPPLDGSLTFPQILEHQLAHSPNHVAYIYDDPAGNIVSVSVAQYITTVHAGCRRVLRDMGPSRDSDNGKGIVVGIFAAMDTISYCSLVAAIIRAGMIPFCISPYSAAAEAVANMLLETDTAAVYVSPDHRAQTVLTKALALCGKQLPKFEAPTFEALQGEVDCEASVLHPIQPASLDSTALLLHTSGSTSIYSKPIYIPHKSFLKTALIPWSSLEDHCGQILSAHNLPNYHALGMLIGTWPFSGGLTIAVSRPTTPPMLPTPENALKGIRATKPDLVMSTPSAIEIWSEDPAGLEAMQSLKGLTYVGAPLNKRVGDALVSKGVVLCSSYGAMEMGIITPFFRNHGKDWDYFSVRESYSAVRVPEEDGSGLYTHTYLYHAGGQPHPVSDLLEQHPENPELHRVVGRKDDVIAFSSTFKMDPGSVESHVNQNRLVDAALVFGHGRTHPGILIQLKPEFHDDLLDTEKRGKVLDALWTSVDEVNSTSHAYRQITRAMIVLADPRKPFALTSKLQPRRHAVFEQYREEIAATYL